MYMYLYTIYTQGWVLSLQHKVSNSVSLILVVSHKLYMYLYTIYTQGWVLSLQHQVSNSLHTYTRNS